MTRRKRQVYTEEFKLQMVNLYLNGKKQSEIAREYDLTVSALRN